MDLKLFLISTIAFVLVTDLITSGSTSLHSKKSEMEDIIEKLASGTITEPQEVLKNLKRLSELRWKLRMNTKYTQILK